VCMVGLIRASGDSWPVDGGLLDMYFSCNIMGARKDIVESV